MKDDGVRGKDIAYTITPPPLPMREGWCFGYIQVNYNVYGMRGEVFWIYLIKYTVSAMRGAIFLDTQVKYTLNAMKGGNIFDTVM